MRQIAFLVSLLFVTSVLGHTWLDCVKMTPQGCQGYIRGYPGRLPGVDTDRLTTYKILGRPSSVPICFPGRQSSDNTYSGQFPMATAYAGEELTFTYTENGHVTKDRIPPNNGPNPKTYTIHWNGRGGRPGAQLTDRNQLNDGTRLLAPTNFDDGQCGEDRNPPMFRNGQPCRGRFRIPDNLQPGVYQFVWWWIFDKIPNAGGEEYTSCFDVRVLSRDNGPAPPPRITPNDPQTARPPAPKPNNPAPNPSDGAGVSCDRCTRSANPNRDTGAGYQYFLQSCLNGGLGCIGNSGCRMCTTKPWRNPGVVQCPSCVYDAFGLPRSLAQGMDSSDNSTFDGDRSSAPSPSPTSSAAGVILSVLAVISVVVLNLLI